MIRKAITVAFGMPGLFLLAPPLWAAENAPHVSEGLGAAAARTGAALLLILGLFFLLVYLLKRFAPRLFTAGVRGDDGRGSIEILSARTLSPKRMLYLVRVGNRTFLIGATDQGLTRLGDWREGGADPHLIGDEELPGGEG